MYRQNKHNQKPLRNFQIRVHYSILRNLRMVFHVCWKSRLSKDFKCIAKNIILQKKKTFIGNGVLSKEEFAAHTGLDFIFKDPVFSNFDSNHDGVLSKDEFVEKPFVAMNQNGKL